jgi:hypothetical protein
MKTLAIDAITLMDDDIYVRSQVNWLTVNRYMDAYRKGADMPPITVNKINGRHELVDGRHRLAALSGIGAQKVGAVIIEVNAKEAFQMQVEANARHGRPLAPSEQLRAAFIGTEKYKLSWTKIADLLNCDRNNLLARADRQGVKENDHMTGVAKAPIASAVNRRNIKEAMDAQKPLCVANPRVAADQWIAVLKAGVVDVYDPVMSGKIQKIRELMDKL